MELKEYLKVFVKYRATFFVVWVIVIAFGLLAVSLAPQKYRATFSIDITRDLPAEGVQEYKYDQFYRLEADDRFGRTIVQWFRDPAIIKKIDTVAGNKGSKLEEQKLETKFRAEKLANSYLKVDFLVVDHREVQPIFLAVKEVLNEKTTEFNGGFNKQNRFKLIFNGPTVASAAIPFVPLLIGLIGGGFFLAAFGIMLRRYLE